MNISIINKVKDIALKSILSTLPLGGVGRGLLLLLGVCGGLSSCSDTDIIPDVTGASCPSNITMSVASDFQKYVYEDASGTLVLPLVVGQQVQFTSSVSPETATYKDVVWTSSDEKVASIDENGLVSALSEKGLGYSIISVAPVGMFSGSNVNANIKVKVVDHVQQATSIDFADDAIELYEGNSAKLDFSISPESATYQTLEWSSSDNATATVDNKGNVTAVSTGGAVKKDVTITAKAIDGSNVVGTKSVVVKRIIDPTSITINQKYAVSNGYYCAKNEQYVDLAYTTVPEECTTSQITWTSSDETIATVADGRVTFVGYGDVTITATCPNGQSNTINLSIPKGLLRETYHNKNHYSFYNASQSGNGTSSSNEWHDGYITITTYKQNATAERGDMKWWDTPAVLHAGNYPIIAVKVDDVKDLYKADGVTARNLNFDCVGKSESGVDYKALGNGNNKYTGDLKCSDGSHVFIYDLSTLAFGTGGLAPTNESISFSTFQIKYADIKTIDHQITYNIYWFQTFKSIDAVKKYITDVDKLTYDVIK